MERSKSFAGHYYSTPYSDIRSDFENRSKSYSFNSPDGSGNIDGLGSSSNPELERRKRVAAYNMYAVEGTHHWKIFLVTYESAARA
ncbi:hypothetical protein CIPAW_04G089000 [Carya illinoinensis]|uniref:Uncharacterized protein n=1 Tax=Carya illinoinensis TaxID=32201 RepID=A0A8T1QR71_CARIL|nr:hypothetical protein CIPAW_04G089000 [Carya illinoinensis]